ncbi:MAG TPA: tellurite resistance/C4-dicarboxylate transporter family protein [Candidatus Melainabacteria bacterium]|nr:tellurite resistance/C4-dicarboxylate transporter family protein [Candidatus Melainabacteria bacterium]
MNEVNTSGSITSSSGKRVSLDFVLNGLASLHPAYFALVMATGIVSIDCFLLGFSHFARLLFAINIPAYCLLILLYIIRVFLYREKFISDCFSHKRAFGFFTIVAATDVLGSQFLCLAKNAALAQALWCTALFLWAACTYSIFLFLIINRQKPNLDEGLNGGWLIAVVATQSLCVLGSQLGIPLVGSMETSSLLLLSFWLFGGMLYLWLISLIFYRYMFFKFEPSDLIPPYWINMGAMAISTLAGSELVLRLGGIHPINELIPFIKGVTLLYWATATWWIPMLLVLGIWRHGIRHFQFKYDPLYWGLVFPLGMYSVCTFKLGNALVLPSIVVVAQTFLVCALLAWATTFLSMLQRPLFALVLAFRAGIVHFRQGGN